MFLPSLMHHIGKCKRSFNGYLEYIYMILQLLMHPLYNFHMMEQ